MCCIFADLLLNHLDTDHWYGCQPVMLKIDADHLFSATSFAFHLFPISPHLPVSPPSDVQVITFQTVQ